MSKQPKRTSGAATATGEAAKTAGGEFHEQTAKTGENGAETADLPAQRDRDAATGQFRPGNAGGPGRPRRSRVAARLDELADACIETIIARALERAANGDEAATRMVLDRRWPKHATRAPCVDLPASARPADLPHLIAAVLRAAAQGELAPAEAAALGTLAEQQRRAFELVEIEQRLAQLERDKDEKHGH